MKTEKIPLSNRKYHKLVDKLLLIVEKNIDEFLGNNDIDCELHHNMMTISFKNGSKIIINRQEPLKQIWMATKKTGYHFEYMNNQWICNRTKKNFWDVLQNSLSNQANEFVKIFNNVD